MTAVYDDSSDTLVLDAGSTGLVDPSSPGVAPGHSVEGTPRTIGLLLLATSCVLDAYLWLGMVGTGGSLAVVARSVPGALAFAVLVWAAAALLGIGTGGERRETWVAAAAAAALVVVTLLHVLLGVPGTVVAMTDLLVATGSFVALVSSERLGTLDVPE